MSRKPRKQRKPGRPPGSAKYDRQVTVGLPRQLLDVIEERMAREGITLSEALRRCLKEYSESTRAIDVDRVVVAISAQDRDDIRRLVSNRIVPSEEFALADAIHTYVPRLLKEIEERRKALGTV